jgi:hypothetical protein
VHPALFKILIRATKSFAKRALVVPSGFVAVPATEKVLLVIYIAFQIAYQVYKNVALSAQHINIIAKDDIMVNHFCNNFDSFCPFYWAKSLLVDLTASMLLSKIRATPPKPTVATTKPSTNPIRILVMLFP